MKVLHGHTPTPWRIDYLDKNNQRVVRGQHIEICTCWHHSVGAIEKEMEANAAFIVRAANSHDDLMAALERTADCLAGLLKDLGGCDHSVGICSCDKNRVVDASRAVLAKARGET